MFVKTYFKIFLFCTAVFSLLYVFLGLEHRLPVAHDTAQYFQQQYVYWNEVVQHKNFPFWFPYISHGLTGNYYSTTQLTLLSPIYYIFAPFLKEANYLYLFYGAMWFEEMFYLLGIILLSSIYFKRKESILFVALTLLGVNIWYPQIFWNFHFYYFIPAVLFCFHKFFLTGKFRYFLFMCLFFMLSFIGTATYMALFSLFFLLVYAAFFLFFSLGAVLLRCRSLRVFFRLIKRQLKHAFRPKRRGLKAGGFLLLCVLIGASLWPTIYQGDQVGYTGSERTETKEVSLDTFLTYGMFEDFKKFNEVFIRYGDYPTPDINLYAGILIVPLCIFSFLFSRNRLAYVIGLSAAVCFLFSSGTWISKWFYFHFPFGKVVRHIGLTATVFKLFLVFYAGFGLEEFIRRANKKWVWVFLALLLASVWFILKHHYAVESVSNFANESTKQLYERLPQFFFGVSTLIFFTAMLTKKATIKKNLVYALIFVSIVDLGLFKYSLLNLRMPRWQGEEISIYEPYLYEFSDQRTVDTFSLEGSNKRMDLFLAAMRPKNEKLSYYATLDSLFFVDTDFSKFRIDFSSKAIKEYNDMKLKDYNNPVYKKFSGVNFSKISFFSKINQVESAEKMASIMRDPRFTGDMIFTTPEVIAKARFDQDVPLKEIDLNRVEIFNERVSGRYKVKNFSFNRLDLDVQIDEPGDQKYFLYYADSYHPDWNAFVEGAKTEVIQVNLGYKAVVVPGGHSQVSFRFGNAVYSITFVCQMILTLWILTAIGYLLVVDLRKPLHPINRGEFAYE